MFLRVVLLLVFCSVFPAAADAAETPLRIVAGARDECAAPTGFPGEIVTTVGPVRRSEGHAAQFVKATHTGLQTGQTGALAAPADDCAIAVSQPNGAGVLAVPANG